MKKILKELVPYIVILVVVVLIRTFIVTPIIVDGDSMSPTLTDDEMMLLNKLGSIERNDIVVINNEEGYIIKRVIALPGESIECRDGVIYINDEKYDDNFASKTDDFVKQFLNDDEYFVMGDNRLVSMDSRIFGAVTKEEILGTTNFVIYPFNKFGKIK